MKRTEHSTTLSDKCVEKENKLYNRNNNFSNDDSSDNNKNNKKNKNNKNNHSNNDAEWLEAEWGDMCV